MYKHLSFITVNLKRHNIELKMVYIFQISTIDYAKASSDSAIGCFLLSQYFSIIFSRLLKLLKFSSRSGSPKNFSSKITVKIFLGLLLLKVQLLRLNLILCYFKHFTIINER